MSGTGDHQAVVEVSNAERPVPTTIAHSCPDSALVVENRRERRCCGGDFKWSIMFRLKVEDTGAHLLKR